jgi:hypothetical protein
VAVYQNEEGALDQVAHFACYVDSLYNYGGFYLGRNLSIKELNEIWEGALAKGIIDPTPTDAGYLEIARPQDLVHYMNLPLQYVDRHIALTEAIPPNTYVINEYYRASNGFHHFCSGGLDGVLKLDPILSIDPVTQKNVGSLTVRYGVLCERRFYTIVG